MHLSGPEQAHEPVAQVFALKQHEDDEHDDDRCRAGGCDERAEDAAHDLRRLSLYKGSSSTKPRNWLATT
ncbi:MAG: hypothetical protein LC647_12110 [Beggiatoa sp.]|nr:hypothetical protein [Beggiatoa sp.]